jgi:hypothetical protein
MAERFDFALGSVEASIVGQALNVDLRQFPLRVGNITVDPVRFVKVAKQVYEALELRRLSIAGELHPAVRTAFELLGKPRVSVSVTGIDGLGGDIAVLTATDGAQALGITQAHGDDLLQFALFADEDLVDVLAGVLPAMNAATTGRHTVAHRERRAVSAMAARRQEEAEFDEEETDAFGNIELRGVVQARTPSRQSSRGTESAEVLERVLAGKRLGGGYIIATGYGRRGEHLTATPLSWLDTEAGRYLVRTETDESGTVTAHYEPAGRVDVARAVRQAIASIY